MQVPEGLICVIVVGPLNTPENSVMPLPIALPVAVASPLFEMIEIAPPASNVAFVPFVLLSSPVENETDPKLNVFAEVPGKFVFGGCP